MKVYRLRFDGRYPICVESDIVKKSIKGYNQGQSNHFDAEIKSMNDKTMEIATHSQSDYNAWFDFYGNNYDGLRPSKLGILASRISHLDFS
ncbi:MAG: hypothetical protein KAT28_03700 [Candidatus Aenigmarchaeota archaeon]|nr:hypothetical protein [Candidatus Aenigmarchaeota archaeon]